MQDKNKTMKIVAIVIAVLIVILICVVAFLLVSRGQQSNDMTTESSKASVESSKSESTSASAQSEEKSSQASKDDAWRMNLSGNFYGNGSVTGSSYPVHVTFDGSKVIVTGSLARQSESGQLSRLDGNEWHFALTDSTVYGYWPEEGFVQQSKDEFSKRFLPSNFPQIIFEVQDGYVTRVTTSS